MLPFSCVTGSVVTGLVDGADMLPERIGRLQEIAQSETIDHEVGLPVGCVEYGVFVHGQRLAVAQQDLSIDNHGVDVVAIGEIDGPELRHVSGSEMRPAQVEEDDVGLLANLE